MREGFAQCLYTVVPGPEWKRVEPMLSESINPFGCSVSLSSHVSNDQNTEFFNVFKTCFDSAAVFTSKQILRPTMTGSHQYEAQATSCS